MRRALTALIVVTCTVLVLSASAKTAVFQGAKAPAVPAFEFDVSWPKELPNNWIVGNVVGVAIDSRDNVWIAQRPNSQPGAEKTPPVIQFDPAGNVIGTIGPPGGPGYEWGNQVHGLYVDHQDNVWVGFGGGLPYNPKEKTTHGNAHFLKFTPKGMFLLQIGEFGMGLEGSNSPKYLGQPTDVWVDSKTNEAYISDGYTNRRVIVVDANTGAYKRHWGAFGKPPDDTVNNKFDPSGPPPQQFNTPHCVQGSNDGLIYVCDRGNQRIQVFKQDGTFVKDAILKASDGSRPAPWDIALSRDPQQRLMFVVDGGSHKVYTVQRESMEVLSVFGRRGRWAGQLESPHNVAIDAKGNLFVAETLDGRRVQKFVSKTTSSSR